MPVARARTTLVALMVLSAPTVLGILGSKPGGLRHAFAQTTLTPPSGTDGSSRISSRISIDAGYAGAFEPTAPIPVRVSVRADRLIRGSLQVAVTGRSPFITPIEVAGGSRKRVLVVLPPPEVSGPVTITASVGAETGSVELVPREGELVGLLDGVARGRPVPPTSAIAITEGSARFALVGEEDLRIPIALEMLGTVAAAPDDLSRAGTAGRNALFSWVAKGGRLLVASDRGAKVPSLTAAQQPGTNGRRAFGDGEIVAAGRSLGSGGWDGIIEPTANRGPRLSASAGRRGLSAGLADELVTDTGFRLPSLGWLAPMLVGYAAAVVVVLASLRRRPLARWVLVPGLAIVTTTLVVALGRSSRAQVTPSQASIIETGPTGTEVTTFVGLTRGEPGSIVARFPRGWSEEALPTDTLAFGAISAALTKETSRAGGLSQRVEVGTGSLGIVAARGPIGTRHPLVVEARAESDDRVGGTVRNDTSFSLDDVAVFTNTGGSLVGSLTPGEQRDWSVFVPELGVSAERSVGLDVWPVPFRFGGGATNTNVNFPAWWAWASTRIGRQLQPGQVIAVGWTRDYRPAVRLERTEPIRGRTAVIGRARISSDPARPARTGVRRTVLRNGQYGSGYGLARFDLPAGVPSSTPLSVHALSGAKVEVLVSGAWTDITAPPVDSDPASARVSEPGGASEPGGVGEPTATTTPPNPADTAAAPPPQTSPLTVLSWTDYPLPTGGVDDGRIFVRVSGVVLSSSVAPIELITVGASPAAPTG